MTLAGADLRVTAPRGWDVAIFQRVADVHETTHAVVHAATFPLPNERGDYGDGAVQRMRAHDVFVALVEFHPSSGGTALFAGAGFPPRLTGDDFSRTALQVSMAGQAGAQRWFTAGGRAWCLYVVVGNWEQRAALAARANQLIAGVEVA
jgi:hypothetical protein